LVNRFNHIKELPQPKPFTVTEWNHCYPNEYAYQTPVLLAAYARTHDWDALFQFAFSHDWKFRPDFKTIDSYFDNVGNAQQLSLNAAASFLFLKGKNIQITNNNHTISSSNLNATISDLNIQITFPELNKTYTIGPIKNKDSLWKNNGKFYWGEKSTISRINE